MKFVPVQQPEQVSVNDIIVEVLTVAVLALSAVLGVITIVSA